ncbi:MAG: FtsK/SpoIIIE domain-containing protein [Polyangiaceae bacterium]
MIELTVSDVRAALGDAARPGDRGSGEAATALLGRLFHEVFADLVSPHPDRSGLRVLLEAGPDRARRVESLTEHAWRKLLAPRLLRRAAELQTTSGPVLSLWTAMEQLCAWLVDVAVELDRQSGLEGADKRSPGVTPWEHLSDLLRAEVPLECELREPTWAESVRLVGVADSVLRVPGKAALCAIEIKLGRATPPVDLGQAALYRLLLVRSGAQPEDAALALLRFRPELEEQLFEANAMREAESRLLDLIAKLARVPQIDPSPVTLSSRPTAPRAEPPSLFAPPVSYTDNDPPPSPHVEMGKKLKRACAEQGVGVELPRKEPVVGPRFLRFEVRLSPGARLEALKRRMPEVAHRLTLPQEPIVTAEAGYLYIDVARPDPETVPFERIVPQLSPIDPLVGSARLPIGVDSAGHLHTADLSSGGRSHVLVAGTSGSGKSEWLRMALAGLIAENTPDTLRVVTIDPKLNAFGELERSRYLWRPDAWWVPGAGREAAEVLDDLIDEMERRYQLTRASQSDNLAEHVKKTGRPLPRIVCLCDEYMALVSTDASTRKRVEQAVTLLGAKARAAGIHLVIATQQPSRAVISGAIQTNLLCRVALTLTSHVESNMILGVSGAERLTGAGDLLYKDFEAPQRLQAPLLTSAERRRLFTG